MEVAAQNEAGYLDFAAYLLIQGELEEEIGRRSERLHRQPDVQEARLLGYLLRAKGDLPGALDVFDGVADDPDSARGVLAELGDWEELARRWDDLLRVDDETLHAEAQAQDPLERLAMAATVYGLAGNEALFQSACGQLHEAATQDPGNSWHAAEALLIAGRIDEAIGLFVEHEHVPTAFDLLAAQLRFDEAFRVAGMDGPGDPFELRPAGADAMESDDEERQRDAADDEPGGADADVAPERFILGLSVAGALHRLGRVGEAETLFERLAVAATDDPRLPLRSVCRAEREAGLDASAFRRAATAIDPESADALLGALFPKEAGEAIRWWNYLAERQPGADPAGRLARVRGIVERTVTREGLLAFASEAEGHVKEVAPEHRAEWFIAVGELRLAATDPDGGQRCFERAVQDYPSADAFVRLADFHFRRGQWSAAAEGYAAAVRRAVDPAPESVAHLVYLEGHARARMDEDDGERLIGAARLLPLGNPRVRHALAEALKQRQLSKETARQWQVILRTGPFNDWALNDAAKQLGNALSGTDSLRAAGYWQRLLMSCLKRNANLTQSDGYLKLSQLIHRLQARGYLEAGDKERALREVWMAHAAMPGDVMLVCDLVPRLEQAGLEAEADRLFEGAYSHLLEVVNRHRDAATLLNNTAWMAAMCDRRLDEALELAERATGLWPDNPTYLDTLAEVHFRRGDRETAMELARRCVELDSEREHYRQQLARFEELP